ncbi:MAG: WecB/TagA/CpsF family glycosyltransferase [Fimbriimonadia bacterium]|nr:WecB/TagA/CpsF family glycosyltransferase [Fimbriimonadia bacterium]
MVRERSLELPTITVLGAKVHAVGMDQTLQCIESFIVSREPHLVLTADATAFVIAHGDPEFQAIWQCADLVTPDGVGLLWAAKRAGTPLKERVSGVDIVREMARLSHERGYKLFLLGAAPDIAEAAAQNLLKSYPQARFVGIRDGYFSEGDEVALLEQIRQAQPDVLIAAMGMPKQEKWLMRHKDRLNVPVSIGVGGSFDVYSGKVKRAPKLFQAVGMEWLWRLLQDPKKIGKVKNLPRFVSLVMREKKH